MATAVDDRFFRNMVTNMRNGVLAIDRDGRVVMINEEACRILEIAPDAEDSGRHFSDLLRHHHDVVRILAGAFEMSHAAEPGGTAAQAQRQGHRLHAVARAGRAPARARGGAVLQGPHAGRTGRGARTAPRSACGPRRDGGHDRARGEEPAGEHRGDGRAGAAPGRRPGGPAEPARGHHQRGEDGQRHRRRGAGVRAADPPPDGPDIPAEGGGGRHPDRRAQGAARRDADRARRAGEPAGHPGRPSSAVPGGQQPAHQRARGAGRPWRGAHRRADAALGSGGVCLRRSSW